MEGRDNPDATVAGTLFVDADGDAVQDAGEAGVGGVAVDVLDAYSTVLGSATTAADGTYAIAGLTPGDGWVRFTVAAGGHWSFHYQSSGMIDKWEWATVPAGGTLTVGAALYADPVITVERVADAVEGGADGTFRFTRTGILTQSLTVYYSVETSGDGAATPGTDYGWLPGSVTFAADAATADVTVDAYSDAVVEGTEWVSLTLAEQWGYEVGWADGAVVLITDKTREVSVAGQGDVVEGGADGVLRFTRTGDLSDPLTVTYTVMTVGPSQATPGDDYTALSGTLTFAAYADTFDVPIETTDDANREPDEHVLVTIAADEAYTVGVGTGGVWITDDDGANMFWISDDDGDWWDPDNWSENRAPIYSDDLYFTGSHLGNMTGMGTGAYSYNGLHVITGYSSTISLTAAVTVGTLEMLAPAVLDQPNGEGSNLKVLSRFEWTKGTINSADTGAVVTLDGAAGEIKPAGQGTVSIGSTLNVYGGSSLEFHSGTVEFAGGDGVNITGSVVSCTAQPNAPANTVTIESDERKFTVHAGGHLRGAGMSSTLGVWIKGGKLSVEDGDTGSFRGSVPNLPPLGPASVLLESGLILLDNGSVLSTRHGVLLWDGKLATRATRAGRQPVTSIVGSLRNDGAQIVISDPAYSVAGAHNFADLAVGGEFFWYSGVYRPFLNAQQGSEQADRILTNGGIRYTGGQAGATFGPILVDAPAGVSLAGRTWGVLEATPSIAKMGETTDPAFEVPAQFEFATTQQNRVGLVRAK